MLLNIRGIQKASVLYSMPELSVYWNGATNTENTLNEIILIALLRHIEEK